MSGDGKRAASAGAEPGTIRLWRLPEDVKTLSKKGTGGREAEQRDEASSRGGARPDQLLVLVREGCQRDKFQVPGHSELQLVESFDTPRPVMSGTQALQVGH